MTSLPILLIILPLAGAVPAGLPVRVHVAGYTEAAAALAVLAAAMVLLVHTVTAGPVRGYEGSLYVDPLGAFYAMTVAIVVVLAAVASAAYVPAELEAGALSPLQARVYYVSFALFASLMLASAQTGNLGLLFVLIEGSTLASAVLVGLEAKSASLEAAWKYVIIASLGVTIALIATLFLFYSATGLHVPGAFRLSWPFLYGHARQLAPASLRLSFILAVVGYGTKVGLAPMHTWLPDAHAEAPSPVSAMLSAALLNIGMYAIMRFLAITRVRLGAGYPQTVLLTFGFLSITIGALFMVRQGNFKRLFAYSSVEHMGIIAVALGFGGVLGAYGALLHTLNHAIGKATLFLASGDLTLGYRSREAKAVRGVLTALPVTGVTLLLASMAILGSPPFGLFLSEFTILRAGFAHTNPALPGLLLLLLVVAFVAFARTITGMVTGPAPANVRPYRTRGRQVVAAVPLLAGVVALALFGVWVPAGLDTVLRHALSVIA